jgi:hypothetical protein
VIADVGTYVQKKSMAGNRVVNVLKEVDFKEQGSLADLLGDDVDVGIPEKVERTDLGDSGRRVTEPYRIRCH